MELFNWYFESSYICSRFFSINNKRIYSDKYKQVEEQIHYDEFVQAKADHWVSILNLKSGLMYSFEEENLHSVNIF